MKIKRKEKSFNFGKTYKPKATTKEEMDASLKELFGQSKQREGQGMSFGQKPMGFSPAKQHPKLTFEPEPIPEPEPEPEDEPYWSPEEWERWAYDMYSKYPDTRQFLPQWFVEAVEG